MVSDTKGWIILGALVATALARVIWVKCGQEPDNKTDAGNQRGNYGFTRIKSRSNPRIDSENPAERQEARETENLRHTASQANAAWATFYVATGALVVSTVGAIVVLSELNAARESARQARRQADTAELNLFYENRATIYFGIPIFNASPVKKDSLDVTIQMGNAGNTSTDSLKYSMACYPINAATNQSNISISRQEDIGGILGPKVSETPVTCSVTVSKDGLMTDSTGQSSNVFMMLGRARYYDAIRPEKQRETRFCYVVTSEKMTVPNLAGFTAITVPCKYQNCADEECHSDPWPIPQ